MHDVGLARRITVQSVGDRLEIGGAVTVRVGIDHGQFIVCDPDADLDIDSYDEAANRQGLASWGNGGGVTVFSASHYTETHVSLELHAERPSLDADAWDHVAESGLTISSGRLNIYGPEDTGINEASVVIEPGSYSIVVCGKDFDTTNEYDAEGNDSYALICGPVLHSRAGFWKTASRGWTKLGRKLRRTKQKARTQQHSFSRTPRRTGRRAAGC